MSQGPEKKIYCFYVQGKSSTELRALGDVFYGLSMDLVVRGSEAILVNLSRSRALYSEEEFLKLADQIWQSYGISSGDSHRRPDRTAGGPTYRWKKAIDLPRALALAKYSLDEPADLPLESLYFFGAPWETRPEIEKKIQEMIVVLKFLGLKNLADFAKLRVRELSSRFGRLAISLHDQVCHGFRQVWPVYAPAEEISERIEVSSEFQIHNLEPLVFGLKQLMDRILLRLKLRGSLPKKFDIIFYQEKLSVVRNQKRSIRFDLSMSLVSPKNLLNMIRERVESEFQKKPLESLVEAMEFLVLEVAPYLESQKDFFDPQREEKEESFLGIMNRVSLKIGEANVFRAQPNPTYLPEKNWQVWGVFAKMSKLDSGLDSGNLWPARPTRLLLRPQKISISAEAIFLGGVQKFRIRKIYEKEVILNQWWDEQLERIYFKVQTAEGPWLWIFRSEKGMFIHGYFD